MFILYINTIFTTRAMLLKFNIAIEREKSDFHTMTFGQNLLFRRNLDSSYLKRY